MEQKLLSIVGKQVAIIKQYDLSDPLVQDDLMQLSDEFKRLVEFGEVPE